MGDSEVDAYFSVISQTIITGSKQIEDWLAMASFIFEMFCRQNTVPNFDLAFRSYCRIALLEHAPLFMRHLATARMCTLIRHAVGQKDPRLLKALEDPKLFTGTYSEIWAPWLEQLVMVSNSTRKLSEILRTLFREMPYRSSLYAQKHGIRDMDVALRQSKLASLQFHIMEATAGFCRSVMCLDIESVQVLPRFRVFLSNALCLSDDEVCEVDLLRLRKRNHPTNPFARSVQFLTKSQIKAIGRFPDFVRDMKSLSEVERDTFFRSIMRPGLSVENHAADLEETVLKFNSQLPLAFPHGRKKGSQIAIFRVEDITAISPEIMTFSATTSLGSHCRFLVQQSSDPAGFHPSVMNVATCMFVFERMLASHYSTARRKIHLPVLHPIEVDNHTVMALLPCNEISLKSLFESDMMMTLREWKKEHMPTGHLNAKGRQRIQKFPKDSLVRRILPTTVQKPLAVARSEVIQAYASMSFVRLLFGWPYPDLERMMILPGSHTMPILCSCFDAETHSKEPSWSPIRLSPIICETLGPGFQQQFPLVLSVISSALIAEIDSVRACLEVLISGELNNSSFSLASVVSQRKQLESRLIAMAPPSTSKVTRAEMTEWFDNIVHITEAAMDPSIQPSYSIPWY